MPFVVKHSGGPEYKKYGVHNGSRCRLKAWQLDEKDEANLKQSSEGMIVLKAMPRIFYIEMEKPLQPALSGPAREAVSDETGGHILDAGCR